MSFKLLSYVRHKEQGIEGLVISPSNHQSSHVTIYDPECLNDDDNPEDSYGPGSALEFRANELEEIKGIIFMKLNEYEDIKIEL